ncbi:MAG: hypothetical protein RI894_2389 [Bacteroidota bacterium]|jgi:hypothetical protein
MQFIKNQRGRLLKSLFKLQLRNQRSTRSLLLALLGISLVSMGVSPHWYAVHSYEFSFLLGDAENTTSYAFQKTISAKNLPYTFCVLHENEETASECVQQFLREIGGTAWEVKADKHRNVTFKLKKKKYSFDPNRIYTPTGVYNTLHDFSRSYSDDAFSQVTNFAKQITDSLFVKKNTLVSVHNSSEGKFSVRSYLPDSTLANTAADLYINDGNDEDEFFYVTIPTDFQYLKTAGFNVVLQRPDAPDDGSLSIYCGARNIRYINVEAQHGHSTEQMQMLYAVHALLEGRPTVKQFPMVGIRPLDSTKAVVKDSLIKK